MRLLTQAPQGARDGEARGNPAAAESFDAWLLVKRQHEQALELFMRLSEGRAKVCGQCAGVQVAVPSGGLRVGVPVLSFGPL